MQIRRHHFLCGKTLYGPQESSILVNNSDVRSLDICIFLIISKRDGHEAYNSFAWTVTYFYLRIENVEGNVLIAVYLFVCVLLA